MDGPDLGPEGPAVRAFLRRVLRLTPAEALHLLQDAAALEREGRPGAADRAEQCLALAGELAGSAAYDVPAAVWAAFETARQGPAWEGEAARLAALEGDPHRWAEAVGAHVSLLFDTERALEQIAAALACAHVLPLPDAVLVLAPWRALTDADDPTTVPGGA
ncbi:MAG: hypothetical protein ACP5VP_01700 [Candidatus Limnocylindrales bacterium]